MRKLIILCLWFCLGCTKSEKELPIDVITPIEEITLPESISNYSQVSTVASFRGSTKLLTGFRNSIGVDQCFLFDTQHELFKPINLEANQLKSVKSLPNSDIVAITASEAVSNLVHIQVDGSFQSILTYGSDSLVMMAIAEWGDQLIVASHAVEQNVITGIHIDIVNQQGAILTQVDYQPAEVTRIRDVCVNEYIHLLCDYYPEADRTGRVYQISTNLDFNAFTDLGNETYQETHQILPYPEGYIVAAHSAQIDPEHDAILYMNDTEWLDQIPAIHNGFEAICQLPNEHFIVVGRKGELGGIEFPSVVEHIPNGSTHVINIDNSVEGYLQHVVYQTNALWMGGGILQNGKTTPLLLKMNHEI